MPSDGLTAALCVCMCAHVCVSLLIAHKAVSSSASAEVHQGGRGMHRLVAMCQSVHTQTPGLLGEEAASVRWDGHIIPSHNTLHPHKSHITPPTADKPFLGM